MKEGETIDMMQMAAVVGANVKNKMTVIVATPTFLLLQSKLIHSVLGYIPSIKTKKLTKILRLKSLL